MLAKKVLPKSIPEIRENSSRTSKKKERKRKSKEKKYTTEPKKIDIIKTKTKFTLKIINNPLNRKTKRAHKSEETNTGKTTRKSSNKFTPKIRLNTY